MLLVSTLMKSRDRSTVSLQSHSSQHFIINDSMRNCVLCSWNTCSTSTSITHFLCIGLPMYLQERRKEQSLCEVLEHSQFPLKLCLVLGRFESLTFLLNLFKAPGFSIHQAHLIIQYMANDYIILFQTCLSPLHPLPSSSCRRLKAVHPEPVAFKSCSHC